MQVEVVFALPQRQELVTVTLDEGATVAQAIERSALAASFPGWSFDECAVGIWGRPAERDQRLADGDRVELYRPLRMDPREARRSQAAHEKPMNRPRRSPGGRGRAD